MASLLGGYVKPGGKRYERQPVVPDETRLVYSQVNVKRVIQPTADI